MGLKDFFGTTQSKNLGGHNIPKAGEQGFQKSLYLGKEAVVFRRRRNCLKVDICRVPIYCL